MKKKNQKKLMELKNLLSFHLERNDEKRVNEIRKELLELEEGNEIEELNKMF